MNRLVNNNFLFPLIWNIIKVNQARKIAFLIGIFICIQSCSEDNGPPHDNDFTPIVGEPLIKPKGQPLDEPYSKIIGSEGGIITYTDNMGLGVRMEIPPAAVDQQTSFSIQSITNTHIGIAGKKAYRLGPENIHFKKPIKVSFIYDSNMEGNSQTRMVAFQRNDGVWCGVSTALDENQRRLTIETTHFSDWVWFDFISLRKNKASVSNGQQVELKLMEQILGSLIPNNHIDSLPLAAMDEIGFSRDLSVSNWKIVQGAGTLESKINTHAVKGNAIYTAPEIIDSYEEVEIQVEINSKNGYIRDPNAPNGRRKFGKLLLLTKIQLIPEGFVSLKLNNIEQNISQSAQAQLINGKIYIRAEDHQQPLTVTLECSGTSLGTYPGGDASGQSQFLVAKEQGGQRYFLNNFYRNCNNEFVFNGTAIISQIEGFVEGSFNGIVYPLNPPDCEIQEPTTVDFQFKIPRTN